jgi:roadblock/LC7 domain-containing protein
MNHATKALIAFLILASPTAALGQGPAAKGERTLVMRGSRLYVGDADGANRRELAEGVAGAAFSPDGNLVAYADAQGIKVTSLNGGGTMLVVRIEKGAIAKLVWSPSGRSIAYQVSIPGESDQLYVTTYPPSNESPRGLGPVYQGVSFSPDGKFIIYTDLAREKAKQSGLLYRVNLESLSKEVLYESPTPIEAAEYSPDGAHIALLVAGATAESTSDDAADCAPPPNSLWILAAGAKRPVRMELKAIGQVTVGDFSWSPDGRFLAIDSGGVECDFPGTIGSIFVISVDEKREFELSAHTPSLRPRFSPDGKFVLFTDFGRYQENVPPTLMIGNLDTRQATPFAGQERRGDDQADYDEVVDWK